MPTVNIYKEQDVTEEDLKTLIAKAALEYYTSGDLDTFGEYLENHFGWSMEAVEIFCNLHEKQIMKISGNLVQILAEAIY